MLTVETRLVKQFDGRHVEAEYRVQMIGFVVDYRDERVDSARVTAYWKSKDFRAPIKLFITLKMRNGQAFEAAEKISFYALDLAVNQGEVAMREVLYPVVEELAQTLAF